MIRRERRGGGEGEERGLRKGAERGLEIERKETKRNLVNNLKRRIKNIHIHAAAVKYYNLVSSGAAR